MKILFTRFPYESAYGGAEVQTMELMHGLSEQKHAVAFLGSCSILLKTIPELHIPIAELQIGKPPVSLKTAISFLWRQFGMKKKLHDALNQFHDLDAICMLSLSEKILLTPFALRKGLKVIWIEHDTVGKWLTKNPWLSTLRNLSTSVTTVCVSDLSAKLYEQLGWKNVVSLPNGVEEAGWSAEYSEDDVVIGCSARLSYEKGVDVLLDAIRDIPDVQVKILGRGRDEHSLRTHAKKIGDRISIESFYENMDDFYKEIDVLVLPSREHDPFGLVAAEAMMRGIPVIVTDMCGISRHMNNKRDGLIIKADSAKALHKAILKMTDVSKRKEVGMNGRTHAQQNFSIEKMVNRYEDLIKM